MKANLTRNIEVKTAIAYLVFEKEQNRPDIVRFLEGEEFEDETINNRVKEYLIKLRILDRDGSVTKKGNRIIETEKLPVQEEGKYKIWFTENDSFLDTKILYFERKSPRDRERIDEINVNFEEENYFLPVKNNEFSFLKLVNTNNISGQLTGSSGNIELVWEWNDLESSYYTFVGELDGGEIKEHKIESNKNLEEYISEIFRDWDYANKKLKLLFRYLTNDNDKRKFKIDYENKNQKNFNTIRFANIPVMPYDGQDAIEWRNWFIEQEIKNDYFLKYDFEKLVKGINNKEGFSAYKDNLDVPEISEYRDKIYSKDRSKQSSAFWHLAAPNDLNPNSDQKYILKSLDYEIGKNISFKEIVNKLIENSGNEAISVFYYDKYTFTYFQQKAMSSFFDAFLLTKNKYLITNTKPDEKQRRVSFIKNNKEEIKEIDISEVFGEKTKKQHNRYIIIAENKEKYTSWQLPSSIDYIKFKDNEIEPEAIGEIIDSISFNQVKKEMLKLQLRTFIENKL